MRYIFALWAAPLILFWGWFFLSLNDINFGYVMLSRQLHDFVFQLYGETLGIDPAVIPGLVARACIIDTGLLLAFWAFRRRREIAAWVRKKRGLETESAGAQPAQPVENALQDEGSGGRIDLPAALGAREVHFDQGALGSHGR